MAPEHALEQRNADLSDQGRTAGARAILQNLRRELLTEAAFARRCLLMIPDTGGQPDEVDRRRQIK